MTRFIFLFTLIISCANLLAQGACEQRLSTYCQGILDGFRLELEIPDEICPSDNPLDCFPISVNAYGFNNFASFQYTLSFDPFSFSFDQFIDTGSLIGDIDTNISDVEEGSLFMLWSNVNGEGESLDDGTELFTLIMCPTGEPGDEANFELTENSNIIEFFHEGDESCIICDSHIDETGFELDLTNSPIISCCGFFGSFDACSNGDGTSNLSFSFCGQTDPVMISIESVIPGISETVIWNTNDMFTFENIPDGQYFLLAEDAAFSQFDFGNGAFIELQGSENLDIEVFISDPPNCSFSSVDYGINILGAGGGAPYEISWSNNQHGVLESGDTYLLEDASQGDFVVTVTDVNGCSQTDEISINIDPVVGTITSQTPATCAGSNDGTLSIAVTGGTQIPGIGYTFNDGSSGFEFNDDSLNPGQGSIIATDDNGCRVEIEWDLGDPVIEPVFMGAITTPVPCQGGAAEYQVTTGGLETPFFIILENADDEQLPWATDDDDNILFINNNALPADTYEIRYTNADGCFINETFVIDEPDEIIVSDIQVVTDPSCSGGDGAATITISGGTGDYNVQWLLDGVEIAIGTNPTTLDAGDYTVMVSDQNGCTPADNSNTALTLTETDMGLIGMIVVDTPLECGQTGGQGIVAFETTETNYSYQWEDENGEGLGSENPLDGIGPGIYFLTVTDPDSPCDLETSIELLAIGDAEITNEMVQDATCGGVNDGSISFEIVSSAMTTVTWEDDPALLDTDRTGLAAGTYNVTITDSDGCELPASFVIENATEIEILGAIETAPLCFGEATGSITDVDLMGGNVATDYNYQWDFNNVQTADLTDVPAGMYILSVTDDNGCLSTFEFEVETTPELLVDIDLANTIDLSCTGPGLGEIALTTSGGMGQLDYTWDPDVSNDAIARDLEAGDYNVTVTDENDCTAVTSYSLQSAVSFTASITIESNTIDCSDTGALSVQVDPPSPDYSYQWVDEFGMETSDAATASGLAVGDYTVIITDADGCTLMVTESIPSAATFDLEAGMIVQPLCLGQDNGSATVNVVNPVGDYNYAWSHDPTLNSDTATDLAEGVFTVSVTDQDDCIQPFSFTLLYEETLELIDENVVDLLCATVPDGSVTAIVSGGTVADDYTYEWNGVPGGPMISDLESDTFDLVVTDDVGCSAMFEFVVDSPDTFSVEIDNSLTLNLGCSGTLTGVIALDVQGGVQDYTYLWTDNVSDSNVAAGIGAGEYFVTVTDRNGCSEIVDFTLSPSTSVSGSLLPINPILCNSGSTEICIDVASLSGGNGQYFYSILNGDAIPVDSCITEFANEDLFINIFDSEGCFMETPIPISLNQPPPISINVEDTREINLGDTLNIIEANITPGSAPIDSIIWTSTGGAFNCIDTLDCNSIMINTEVPTQYQITVVDEDGCRMTEQVSVNVLRQENVYLPTVFNPNASDSNGTFSLQLGSGVDRLNYLRIFDRWGNLVFQQEDEQPSESMQNGWDGGINNSNELAPAGVYAFIAEVLFVDGKTNMFSGSITLIR